MPTSNGEYQKFTAEEIQERLEYQLEQKLGTTAQPGDLVTQQLAAEAEVLSQNQEEALERVYQAAYLADATGDELDKVVDVIGLSRMEATSATGTVRFWRDTPPTTTYTIPKGSTVQTSGTQPVEFETTETSALDYISGFEDNNFDGWTGDVGSFNIIQSERMVGSRVLEIPATADVSIRSADDYSVGSKFSMELIPKAGSVTAFRFGIQDDSNYYECVVDENAQDLRLRLIADGNEVALSNNDSATVPEDDRSYLEVEWGLYQDTKATIYESEDRNVEITTVSMTDSKDWSSGKVGVGSLDGNATTLFDELAVRSVLVNVESLDEGRIANLGANSITTISRGITGVESVSNPVATGNPNHKNTDFTPFVLGETREDDEQLRDRAFNSTSIGGSATVNAIGTELRRVDGVKAITLNRNREESTVNGLPPHSFEAIVYGGSDEDIADTIFNTASIDSHDVGGINGTEATYQIVSDVTKETETISWSRPNRLDLNITLDLIVDETYAGDEEIQDIIVRHIGGTGITGKFINGLDVGEDIYEAVLKRKIVNPDETGVWEVNNLSIDKDGDGTDDTETTASGAEVLVVSDNEVAITDARDGSITISKNQK
jgi:hypothetical protein